MSTNKTQNYNLHSWLPDDDFQLSEINANFAALDASLAAKPDILVGSYVGLGATELHVDLGRRPAAVHIERTQGIRDLNYTYGGLAIPSVGLSGYITFDDTGFTVKASCNLNSGGSKCLYVAFFVG